MMMSRSLTRLKNIIIDLKDRSTQLDRLNSERNTKPLPWQESLFSENLFHEQSYQYLPYVLEIETNIKTLEKLLSLARNEIANAQLTHIEQQVSSLSNALNANEALYHETQYQQAAGKRRYNKKQKEAIKAVVAPSQNLYQKLVEHHEFERRLHHMLLEAETERSRCSAQKQQQLGEKVLTLHQRLGRCRKAISTIERDIERFEKRQ